MRGHANGLLLSIFFTAFALSPAIAHGASVWNEGTNGDLANDGATPSNVALAIGSNTLTATVDGSDRDVFHVSIPAGGALQSLVLQSYASNDLTAFIAVQSGSTFVGDPNLGASMLGYSHFGTFAVGQDILDDIGFGGDGFTPPLTGSDYTFWVQQLGSTTAYTLDFNVTPEPGCLALLALAGLTMISRPRRT